MKIMNLNELRDQIHANAVEKGFWDKPISDSHCLMLVITELSEAVEADRKTHYCDTGKCKEMLAVGKEFDYVFCNFVKDTVSDELADAFIRLLDLAGTRNINVTPILMELFPDCQVFTEHIYRVCAFLTDWKNMVSNVYLKYQLSQATSYIFAYCERNDIDLMWHVEMKMKYNQSRERMHGKKY